MTAGYAPPHGAPADPRTLPAAPRRSRFGLASQFVLQFLYLPPWILTAVLFVVLVIAASIFANGGGDAPDSLFKFRRKALSWRRLRVEWSGTPEAWAPFTEELLTKRFRKAEEDQGWWASTLPPNGDRTVTANLPLRYYRGLAPAQLEWLASKHGWSVDWTASKPGYKMRFTRVMAPPQHIGVPHPATPAPAPGTPWGPLPRRAVLPVLTFPLMPRTRRLELGGDAAAYEAHLRQVLGERFAKELKRDTAKGYVKDEHGEVMRRVAVSEPHYRCAGAHAVLRVAAEQGWYLDPAFRAEPTGVVHLARPGRLG